MGCFAALGIDINKSYVAFSWVTNDPDLAASALGAWGAHPITSWLFEEHLAFKTPLKLPDAPFLLSKRLRGRGPSYLSAGRGRLEG